MMQTPALSGLVPELWDLIASIGAGIELGTITDEDQLGSRIQPFFTHERLESIDTSIPGWHSMATIADGKTLLHTVSAAAALTLIDEYRGAPTEFRRQLEWVVLLHDLRKEPNGGRDHRHAFRSGAWAGRVLPRLGFRVSANYQSEFEAWYELLDAALIPRSNQDGSVEWIQDNTKLGIIVGGAARLFTSPATEMIKAITLHQSISVVEGWPVAAPLSSEQERSLIDPDTRALLLPLMLADSGGWNLFAPEVRREMYASTRARLAA